MRGWTLAGREAQKSAIVILFLWLPKMSAQRLSHVSLNITDSIEDK